MIDPTKPDFNNTPLSANRPRYQYSPAQPVAEPSLSIVTPYYNTGEVFLETVQCVAGQTFQDWEWLIINDGSKPEHDALLEKIASMDARVRIIKHPENKGLPAGRNTGFAAARAGLVLQLDSDDYIEPTYAEKVWWFLQANPEFSFASALNIGFGGQEYVWNRGFEQRARFLTENHVQPTAMIRRNAHEAVGGYDETMRHGLEDWDYWLRMADHGFWGHTIREHLVWYRRRAGTNAAEQAWPQWGDREGFLDQMRKRYPKLFEKPDSWPNPKPRWHMPHETPSGEIPSKNLLSKTKRRVLCLFPHFELGGADKFNLNCLSQLASSHGWEMTIVTTRLGSKNQWTSHFAAITPEIFVLENYVRLSDYPRFLRYLAESRQVDVIFISHSIVGYNLIPYLRHHLPKVAVVDYVHMEEEYWRNGGYPRYSANYSDFIDRTGASSKHLKEWMVARGARPERIEICPTPPDTRFWNRDDIDLDGIRKRHHLPKHKTILLFSGRLNAQKQPKLLIEVAGGLRNRGLDFQLIIAGDGEERALMENTIKTHHLKGRVWILGMQNFESMRELLAIADIFLLPSRHEGISLAIYEAMAMGVVPVSAAVGGQPELVTPDCGVLIERGPDECRHYVDALARLIEDPDLRRKMAAASKKRIKEHYSFDDLGASMSRLFLDAAKHVAENPAPPLPPMFVATLAGSAIEDIRINRMADALWVKVHATSQKQVSASTPPQAND